MRNSRSHAHFDRLSKPPAQSICFQTTSLLTHAEVSHSSSSLRSVPGEGVPFTENHSHSIKQLYFKSAKRGVSTETMETCLDPPLDLLQLDSLH